MIGSLSLVQQLAELITLDDGKLIIESLAEIDRATSTFRYNSGEATKFYGRRRFFQPSTYRVCPQLLCTRADFREFGIFDQDAGGLQLIEALFTVAEVFAQNLTIVFAGH